MTPFRHRRGLMETRRATINRIDSMTVKSTWVEGRTLFVVPSGGTGEVIIDLVFPCHFTEPPQFTYASELDDNHRPAAGRYPRVSAGVAYWQKEKEVAGAVDGYYVGVGLLVRITGSPGQHVWLHHTFHGKALVGPLVELEGTDDTI